MRHLRFLLVGLVALAVLVMSRGSVSTAATASPLSVPDAPSSFRPPSVPGELLVKFKPGTSRATQLNAERAGKTAEVGRIPSLDMVRLRTPPGRSDEEMIQVFRKNPAVEFAEPNLIATTAAEPTDTSYSVRQRWYYNLINAPAGWDITTGSPSVIVASVDTGVELTHPDLDSKIWVNGGEIAANGLDDDGNGCIDDVNGCNFINDPPDGDSNDDSGHGSFGAGIVGAESDNAQGVTAMAWGSTIMPIKVLDSGGSGTAFDIAEGITYAAANGAQVINLSLGFGFGGVGCPSSDSVGAAIASAHDVAGAVIVAATGNDGASCVAYPASDPNTVAVGASGFLPIADERAPFSNYGPEVDVVAPGERIFSTDLGGTYDDSSGTSFSTPMVSGLAALLLAQDPGKTNEQVRAVIKATARDLPDGDTPNWDGAGRIDVTAALGGTSLFAQVTATSSKAKELDVFAGVGDPTSPLCSILLVDGQFGIGGLGPFANMNASFGVSPCAAFWPPTPANPWFLRIVDTVFCDATQQISSLSLEDSSAVPIIATDTPVSVTCNAVDQATSTIDAAGPDLAAAKSANLSAVPALGPISYNVTTRNLGSAQATNVIMRDTLPPEATLVGVTPGSPTCVNAGPIITCSLGNLAANDGADGGPDESIVTIDVTAPDVVSLSLRLTNCGEADPDGVISEFNEVNNASCADVTVRSADPTLTVNSTADPGDSICDTTECTLREAIAEANARPGGNTILFDIPVSDPGFDGAVFTIDVGSSPLILSDDATEIDGTSQPGFSSTPIVRVVAGGPAAFSSTTFRITSSSNIIRGLLVNKSPAEDRLKAAMLIDNGQGNEVQGNFIGTDPTGAIAQNEPVFGFVLIDAGPDNLIGGIGPGDGNVLAPHPPGNVLNGPLVAISGGGGNLIQGNMIGTDKTGTQDIGSSTIAVLLEATQGNLIGGTAPGARNVITSGLWGVVVTAGATDNTVQGNYIGVDATGENALPNGRSGVFITGSASGNLIGGPEEAARNIISGNGGEAFRRAGVHIGVFDVVDPATPHDNIVQGNWLGPSASCDVPLGLPTTSTSGIVLNGRTFGNQIVGNVVSGNVSNGITIEADAHDNVLHGNIIGMDCSGAAPLPNGGVGIVITSGAIFGTGGEANIIGGVTAQARNIIAGHGVNPDLSIISSGTANNQIIGNYINCDINGQPAGGSSTRIRIAEGAQDNILGGQALGEGNLICGDPRGLVKIDGTAAIGDSVLGNDYLVTRFGPEFLGGAPIDLRLGGNTELPAPLLDTLVLSIGPVTGTACADCLVEVYSHPGSGVSPVLSTFEGRTVADAGGNFSLSGVPAGPKVFATNTDAAGNTSEFSVGIVVPTGCVSDADCDGLNDGSDPCPTNPDCDGDGLGDGSDPCPSVVDCDGDGWTDWQEFAYITTDPENACTPGGYVPDPAPAPNGNGIVGIDDVFFAAGRFNQADGDPNYTRRAEIGSQDGTIGIDDVFGFAGRFNQSC